MGRLGRVRRLDEEAELSGRTFSPREDDPVELECAQGGSLDAMLVCEQYDSHPSYIETFE
jgi:hypothetical protein